VAAVIVYGLVLAYLLALIPAAVLCCRKGQWGMFFAGWLTFGLVWFVGAASDESRRTLLLGAAGVLILAVVLGAFGARPAPVLGIDGSTLQRSVGGELANGRQSGCEREAGRDWKCFRYDDSASSWLGVRVHVNSMGCWKADGPASTVREAGGRDRGCIFLSDYVDLAEKLI
jgi:hypothetical protein